MGGGVKVPPCGGGGGGGGQVHGGHGADGEQERKREKGKALGKRDVAQCRDFC